MRPHAIRAGTTAAALLIVLTARDGAAQTSEGTRRVFAGASAAWNIDKSVSHGAETAGGALAVGVAFGLDFADRWSVQVEGEWPTSDQTTVDEEYSYRWGNETNALMTRSTYRTPTVAVLFGVHWRLPKRVDIAFQFGPSLQHQERDYESQHLVNGIVDHSYPYSSRGSEDYSRLGVSLGADLAVAVTPRVAVVGQVRVHMVPNLFEEADRVVRPAVGVRVRF
jgi:hypothetical protein